MPVTFDGALERSDEAAGRWYGVYPALVCDIRDPDAQGRVKVRLPWSPDSAGATYEAWARLATMMAGNNRGSWFLPDVNDEVLVAFEAGDARRPYVVGSLWNGTDAPPESLDGGGNNYKKVLRSRNGVRIELDDQDGQEKIVLETPGGQKLTLKDGPGTVELADANGNSIKMDASGVTITSAARLTLNAGQLSVSASQVTIDAGMTKCSGVVQTTTLIATASVVSPAYTPGAGNVW